MKKIVSKGIRTSSKGKDLSKIIIEVEKLEIVNNNFVVTVFNRGNLSSSNTKINIYIQPLGMNGFTSPLALVAEKKISLGILERKSVQISPIHGSISPFITHFAIAYDILHDPFPLSLKNEYIWSECNVLNNGLPINNLHMWEQWSYNSSNFQSGSRVENKTWKLLEKETIITEDIKSYYAPQNTPTKYSELRQNISITSLHNGNIIQGEIGRGNVDLITSYYLNTFTQTPRDNGNLWIKILRGSGQTQDLIFELKPSFVSPKNWTHFNGIVKGAVAFNQIQVRLLSVKNKGNNNDTYFAKINIQLKHRQMARYAGFDFFGFFTNVIN